MNKEEFKAFASKQIDDVSEKLDQLKAKKDEVSGELKVKYADTIVDLKEKKTHLKTKFEALEHASEDKWEEVKTAFSNANDSFKEGFSKISQIWKKEKDETV
jgi:cytochrome c556